MYGKNEIKDNLINILQEEEITKFLPAEGISMYPLIKTGDSIKIRFTKPNNLKAGDIVAFKRGNTTVVHRLIKKNGNCFVEKGDFQMKGTLINKDIIFGKMEIAGQIFNPITAAIGYTIHKYGRITKPLLIIPYLINAGTRFYIKLFSNKA